MLCSSVYCLAVNCACNTCTLYLYTCLYVYVRVHVHVHVHVLVYVRVYWRLLPISSFRADYGFILYTVGKIGDKKFSLLVVTNV